MCIRIGLELRLRLGLALCCRNRRHDDSPFGGI